MSAGLPAESFDEGGGALGDLLGELDHVDPSQDDVVGHHGIGARKWRAADSERKRCFIQSPTIGPQIMNNLGFSTCLYKNPCVPAAQQLKDQYSQRPAVS